MNACSKNAIGTSMMMFTQQNGERMRERDDENGFKTEVKSKINQNNEKTFHLHLFDNLQNE